MSNFFRKINKKILIAGIFVIISGILVGGIIKSRENHGQVKSALTEATRIESPLPTETPPPTDTPIDQPTITPVLDNNAEGASPTDIPTTTPSPTPDNYSASIKNISNQSPNVGSTVNIMVNAKDNKNAVGGVTLSLSSDSNISFSPISIPSDSSGNATFTATSNVAGTYTITAKVYGMPYGNTNQITFTSSSPTP